LLSAGKQTGGVDFRLRSQAVASHCSVLFAALRALPLAEALYRAKRAFPWPSRYSGLAHGPLLGIDHLLASSAHLFNKYVHKHRGPGLSQPKQALLMACAASNAKRVGDKSWSRRIRRLKGWRRQRLREFEHQHQLEVNQSRNVERPRAGYSDAVWMQTSRLSRV